ncbi:hypothetical protein [Terricaulis sp.]|uniref:hypothetical protein n=1 Tax=Terricaulis sp. TaxID=2768686 RepID=UPI003782F461
MLRYILMVGLGAVIFLIVMGVLREFVGGGATALIYAVILIASIVVIARNLMSNRKVKDATPQERARALAFEPEPGRGVVYVMRTQFIGMAVGVNLIVDGVEVAQIKSPRFTRFSVSPGAHRIAAYVGTNKKPADGEGFQFSAEAGGVSFIFCEVEPQMIGAIVKFRQITLEQARKDLQKARMVSPDVAAV